MELDRRVFIASLGGVAAVSRMSAEAKADALEDYMTAQLARPASSIAAAAGATQKFPTAAEIEKQIETRPYRRGVGGLFVSNTGNMKQLAAMPAVPTLLDYFNGRFGQFSNHCLQSAALALKNNVGEEMVLACLLHDTVQALIKVDHGWWGAQMYEPYVSEKVSFAIRHHQTLRFYEDTKFGYVYPDLYRRMFGEDYKPEAYIQKNYEMLKKHKWYEYPRIVTVNDLYAFDANAKVTMDPFVDIIGRHFKQPKEGLGFDGSPVAHMWRSMFYADHPL